MSTNIGNLAVMLTLDAVAFTAGLDKGDKGLKSFAAGAAKAMAAVAPPRSVLASLRPRSIG